MFSRRLVLSGMLAAPALPLIHPARAQDAPDSFDVVREWGFVPSDAAEVQAARNTATGTKPARHEEVTTAFGLLFGAPQAEPIKVARYFEGLKAENRDGQLYNQEWPLDGRANPVIVGFFSMTNTLPSEGDQTAWCAAFVNFCLVCGKKPITLSALSGSFRKYEEATENPKPGDLVVFAKANMPAGNLNGHVGFYVSSDAAGIEVLGGNQVGNTGTTGAVTRAKFPYQSSSLKFHSYRAVP